MHIRPLAVSFALLFSSLVVACAAEPVGDQPEDDQPQVNVETGSLAPSAKTCHATSCRKLGATCGTVSDGCGGILSCGTCAAPETCGGGGVSNVCGG